MTDLVAELRRKYECWALGQKGPLILIEAAAEIERLQSAVEAERTRCTTICEGWIGTFQDREIKYTSPRAYAVNAIEDIIDLIRDGHQPGAGDVGGPAHG